MCASIAKVVGDAPFDDVVARLRGLPPTQPQPSLRDLADQVRATGILRSVAPLA